MYLALGDSGIGAISFPNLGIKEFSINNVAFRIFGLEIYWYAIIIATGFLLAVFLGMKLAKKTSITQDNLLDAILWITPFAVVCARLYYVVFDSKGTYESFLDIINIRGGGLGIYGGVIGATIGVFVFCRIKKIKVLEITDIVAPCFLLGQLIGRWGNFVNQEAYGAVTDVPWAMQIYIDGQATKVHPTFLYESLWNLAGLFISLAIFKNRKHNGTVSFFYMIWYGVGRFIIESLRTDQLLILGIPVSMLVAALSVFGGALGLFILNKGVKTNGSID